MGDILANERAPVDLVITACNGETVELSGDLHFAYQITTAASGNVSSKVTNDYSFSGVGSVTGAKYEGGMHFVDKEILNLGAATVFSDDASLRLIAQGNVPNTWLDYGMAFTIDANGNVSHDTGTYSTRCQ